MGKSDTEPVVELDIAQDYVMADNNDDATETRHFPSPLQLSAGCLDDKSQVSLDLKSDKSSASKRHLCDVCGKTLASFSALTTHKRTHSGEKPYVCHICSKVFTQKSGVNIHMNRKHRLAQLFACEECDHAFSSSSSLARHKKVHLSRNPNMEWLLTCHLCGVTCTTRYALNEHVQAHSGQVHECDLCHKTYRRARDLTWHKKQQHFIPDGSGTKSPVRFQCHKCDKAYSFPSSLERHVQTKHKQKQVKPHKCGECSASFHSSSDLKVHRRIHTGEKPYKCKLCNAAFRYSYSLRDHRKSHP